MEKEKSWFRRHWILTGLGVFILLIIIGGMSSTDTPSTESGTTLPTEDNIKTYNLNEEIIMGNFKYVFKSVETRTSIGSSYVGNEANGIFLIIDLEVENIGNEADYISNEIYVIDNQGREFSQDDGSWIFLDDNFIFEELNPGLTKKGQLIFDVPEGISGKACIKKSIFSSNCEAYIIWN
jgi:hypothetical protein